LDKAAKKWNCEKSKIKLTQDEDVLDTWFSSALLPFSVFGWPDISSDELKAFFPTDLLETGHDIIFFWVARMVFMSYFFMDQLPFHTVFLHPIVRDAQGRKMSKSLGNVIDPLEVINGISLDGLIEKIHQGNLPASEVKKSIDEKKKEFPQGIPECGADALRLGLMSYLIQGKDINLDISRVISYRFFGNKLWNAVKFMHYYCLKDGLRDYSPVEINSNTKLTYIDRWILNKLNRVIKYYDESFENYNFADATSAIYSFWQDNLCDVYVEAVKPVFMAANTPNSTEESKEISNISKNVLIKCIESGLKLLHPLMPFITEELYQRLPKDLEAESICITKFPSVDSYFIDDVLNKQADVLFDISHSILSILSQFQINKIKPNICIYTEDAWLSELIEKESLLLATLSRTSNVKIIISKSDASVKGWLVNVFNSSTDFYLDLKNHINVEKEIERLNKNLKEKLKFKEELEKKIASYGPKVPEETKKTNLEKLNNTNIEIEKINTSIESLKAVN
jgi:valyl-tRNA synthetase